MKLINHSLAYGLIMLALVFSSPQVLAGDYVVIVSVKNSFASDDAGMRNEIKRLYLKEKKKWSNGLDGKPLSAKTGSDEQRTFLSDVLHMDPASLAQHWIKSKQKTGDTPPRSVGSARSMIKLVARGEGSFGYISKVNASNLNDKVRILFEF